MKRLILAAMLLAACSSESSTQSGALYESAAGPCLADTEACKGIANGEKCGDGFACSVDRCCPGP